MNSFDIMLLSIFFNLFNSQKIFMENNIIDETHHINCHLNFSSLIHSVVDANARGEFHQFHIGDCLQQLNQKYVYLQLGAKNSQISSNIGLCVSNTCSNDMVAQEIIQPSFQILKIENNLERYEFSYNWVSVLTVLIMFLSLVFIVVAKFKRKGQKQENKLLKCFDVMENLKNFRLREGEPLMVLDGVRAIAMIWVVLVHIYMPSFRRAISEINVATHYNKPFNLVFLMGYISVDIFLCLGGFFLMFVTLRQKQINLKYCLSSLFRRISRIWPVFIYVIMIYYSLFPGFGLGANWKPTVSLIAGCQNAWKSIFFVSNIYNKGQEPCLQSQWYLQVDFQLFLTVTFLMLIYQRSKNVFLTIIFALLSIVAINDYFLIAKTQIKHSAFLEGLRQSQYQLPHITSKPYYRCLSHLVGVIIGSFYMDYRLLFKAKKDFSGIFFGKLKKLFEESTFARRAFECCGLAIILAYTLSPRYLQIGGVWPQWAHSFYWVSVKIVFPFAVMMVACPSMLGCKSMVSVLLRNRILQILARVSFSTFLIHTLIVDGYFNRVGYDLYYNMVIPINTFFGIGIQSIFCGFVLMMTIELPSAGMIALIKDRLQQVMTIKNPQIETIEKLSDQVRQYLKSGNDIIDRADEQREKLYQK